MPQVKEESVAVEVASMKKEAITGKHGYPIHVDITLAEVKPDEFDMLVLPGGRSPERVRLEEKALDIARYFLMRTNLWD